jgi:hypothetical protein
MPPAADQTNTVLTTEDSDLHLLGETYQGVPIVNWSELILDWQNWFVPRNRAISIAGMDQIGICRQQSFDSLNMARLSGLDDLFVCLRHLLCSSWLTNEVNWAK